MSKLLLAILVTVFAAGTFSAAQAEDLVSVQMTHEFSVGKTVLPAGSYTIERVSPEASSVLLIRSDDGKSGRLIVPSIFESRNGGDAQLDFVNTGGAYALTEIRTSEGIYSVATTGARGSVAKNLPVSSNQPGSGN